MRPLLLLMLPLVACEGEGGLAGPYGPPPVPVHDVLEEGHLHARGHETPYLCLSLDGRRREACPEAPPPLAFRSCDSSGCHGTFTYDTPDDLRALDGDEAPSCWPCHDREWSRRKE